MKNKFLIIIIIVISAVFSLSFGYWLGQSKETCKSALAELEKSKAINSWMVSTSGEIGGISGKTLTLLSRGETIDIAIIDSTIISSFVSFKIQNSSTGGKVVSKSEQKDIAFEELKVGDEVTVLSEVKASGKLEASSVNVFNEIIPAE